MAIREDCTGGNCVADQPLSVMTSTSALAASRYTHDLMTDPIAETSTPYSNDPLNFVGRVGAVIISVMIGVGVVGNLLVLAVIVRCRQLRRSYNVFIASLSVTDLIFNVAVMPFYVDTYARRRWRFSHAVCRWHTFFGAAVIVSSSLHIALIAASRYYVIVRPRFYSRWLASRTAVAAQISAAWATAVAFVLPSAVGALPVAIGYSDQLSRCNYIRAESHDTLSVMFVGGFIVPCVAMTYCYGMIWRRMRQVGRRMDGYGACRLLQKRRRRRRRKTQSAGASPSPAASPKDADDPSAIPLPTIRVCNDAQTAVAGKSLLHRQLAALADDDNAERCDCNRWMTGAPEQLGGRQDIDGVMDRQRETAAERLRRRPLPRRFSASDAIEQLQCNGIGRQPRIASNGHPPSLFATQLPPTAEVKPDANAFDEENLNAYLVNQRQKTSEDKTTNISTVRPPRKIFVSPSSPEFVKFTNDVAKMKINLPARSTTKASNLLQSTSANGVKSFNISNAVQLCGSTSNDDGLAEKKCMEAAHGDTNDSPISKLAVPRMLLTDEPHSAEPAPCCGSGCLTVSLCKPPVLPDRRHSALVVQDGGSFAVLPPIRRATSVAGGVADSADRTLSVSTTPVGGGGACGRHHRSHSLRMIVAVCLAFVLTYLPYTLTNLADVRATLHRNVYMVTSLAFWAGSCVNPLIYGIMNAQFRRAYVAVIVTCWHHTVARFHAAAAGEHHNQLRTSPR